MRPMLCQKGDVSILKQKDYLFEPKLDGVRVLAVVKGASVRLLSRKGLDVTARYPEIKVDISVKSAVLDGEIVVYDEEGNPNFQLLQSREQLKNRMMIGMEAKEFPVTLVVFDVLRVDGKSVTKKPIEQRKRILKEILSESGCVQVMFDTHRGEDLWRVVKARTIEGVIAKKKGSVYVQGERSQSWLKIKIFKSIDAIIVGFTQEKRIVSSLALGVYDEGRLRYIGRVGTGFSEKFLESLYARLRRLAIKRAPVEYTLVKEVHWVKPQVVCEVAYLEWSRDKRLRSPTFVRLREDKPPEECVIDA